MLAGRWSCQSATLRGTCRCSLHCTPRALRSTRQPTCRRRCAPGPPAGSQSGAKCGHGMALAGELQLEAWRSARLFFKVEFQPAHAGASLLFARPAWPLPAALPCTHTVSAACCRPAAGTASDAAVQHWRRRMGTQQTGVQRNVRPHSRCSILQSKVSTAGDLGPITFPCQRQRCSVCLFTPVSKLSPKTPLQEAVNYSDMAPPL